MTTVQIFYGLISDLKIVTAVRVAHMSSKLPLTRVLCDELVAVLTEYVVKHSTLADQRRPYVVTRPLLQSFYIGTGGPGKLFSLQYCQLLIFTVY